MRELVLIWVSMIVGLALLAFGTHRSETRLSAPPTKIATTSQPIQPTSHNEVAKKPDTEQRYAVVKVVDGDTVVVERNGKNETLRLIGMDAPETTTLRKGTVECFGDKATRRAEELLKGEKINLETDTSQDTYDKYGRTLAYAFLPDGKNFAEVMIGEGYAHEYTYRLPYKYQAEFRAAQHVARTAKRGLWADNACTRKDAQGAAPAHSAGAATVANIECSKNTYNCSSFKTQAEAQAVFDHCGLPGQGGSSNDVHKLDSDGDGRVCEGLR